MAIKEFMNTKNPYYEFVESFSSMVQEGKNLPLGEIQPPPDSAVNPKAPKVAILSPHPDDECVMGPLALRLKRETGSEIVNVPITFGSNPARKEERKEELSKACKWIGFKIENLHCGGLERITPETRSKDPRHWENAVSQLIEVIHLLKPDILFFPNANDWNLTHLGVHLLTYDSLNQIESTSITLIETEFWGQIKEPNLMVESSHDEVGDLVAALSHHKGEVTRNPFHLRLPTWMQDNVRRGAEVVGGQGGNAPEFDFATLYRVSRMEKGKIYLPWKGGRLLGKAKLGERGILEVLK